MGGNRGDARLEAPPTRSRARRGGGVVAAEPRGSGGRLKPSSGDVARSWCRGCRCQACDATWRRGGGGLPHKQPPTLPCRASASASALHPIGSRAGAPAVQRPTFRHAVADRPRPSPAWAGAPLVGCEAGARRGPPPPAGRRRPQKASAGLRPRRADGGAPPVGRGDVVGVGSAMKGSASPYVAAVAAATTSPRSWGVRSPPPMPV